MSQRHTTNTQRAQVMKLECKACLAALANQGSALKGISPKGLHSIYKGGMTYELAS